MCPWCRWADGHDEGCPHDDSEAVAQGARGYVVNVDHGTPASDEEPLPGTPLSEQFVRNFSAWYDRANVRFEARKRQRANPFGVPPVQHWAGNRYTWWQTLAVLGWMRGVVEFEGLEAYRCPSL